MPAPDRDTQALFMRAQAQFADFKIITSAMELGSWRGEPVVNMIGSSTIRDRKNDVMTESALVDMTKVEPGMVIWLNHDYKLPDSLFGSLIKSPSIKYTDSYADLHVTSDVEMGNAAAARTYAYIDKGRKIGCSIGARVDEARIDEELFEKKGEIALIIEHVTPVEWSVVGVPCNQRSWVENAIKGYGLRELQINRAGADERLFRLTKSLWPRQYHDTVKAMHGAGVLADAQAQHFWDLEPVAAPPDRIVWDPPTGLFKLFGVHGGGEGRTIEDRATLAQLLGLASGEHAQAITASLLSGMPEDEAAAEADADYDAAHVADLQMEEDDQELVAVPADMLAADEHPEGERNQRLPVTTPADNPLADRTPWRDAQPEGGLVLLNGIDFAALRTSVAQELAATPALATPAGGNTFYIKSSGPIAWLTVPDSARTPAQPSAPAPTPTKTAPAPQQETPTVKTKTKAVWAVAWKAYPTFKAEGDTVSTSDFAVMWTPLSITKDGVERLTPEAIAANTAEVEAKLAALSDAQKATFDAFLKAESYPAHEAKATEAFHAQRKAEKATQKAAKKAERAAKREEKLAAAAGLLTKGDDGTVTPTADAGKTAKFSYLTTLATELGVKVKASGLKLPEDETYSAKRQAAAAVLRQARRIVKSGAAISEKNMANLQLAHDALAIVTDGTICAKGVEGNPGTPGQQLAAGTLANGVTAADLTKNLTLAIDTSGLQASIDALKGAATAEGTALSEKITATRVELARLEQQVTALKAMPLGRPTLANTRVVTDPAAATWADMAAATGTPAAGDPATPATPAPDDLLTGTQIRMVKRGGFDMKVRHWPDGYAAERRPALDPRVKPYMLIEDILNYRSGGPADVPELD